MKLKNLFLVLIIILAFFLRIYKIGEIPAGIHQDEESHGYNAFSLIHTGKDRYGEPFPILFRSFGSYQPPIYTYLATLPVGFLGNSIGSVRLVSAVAGTFLTLITYFFVKELFSHKRKEDLALIASLIIAISPWAIYFSRLVAEGNLGVTFFALSLLLMLLSLKKVSYFPLATLALAISTHAYYSERVLAILFLPIFIYLYRNYFWKQNRRFLILGLSVFVLVMLPHAFIATSGALTRRLVEVGYVGQRPFIVEFIRRYLTYFSPRNLFFDLGSDLGRMPPELGVFYTILIVPFLFGVINIKKFLKPIFFKLFVALVLIAPIPAAFTGDSYYPLRSLVLIWLIAIIISAGILVILNSLPRKAAVTLSIIVIGHALFSFYISYFVLFKYERAKDYGNAHMSLINYLDKYRDYKVIVDSSRYPGAGLRYAYLTSYDPIDLQQKLKSQLKSPYYSGEVALYEDYVLGNVEFRKLDWGEIECSDKLLVIGDKLSISDVQAKEHNLKFEFEVKDISGYDGLIAYLSYPVNKCDIPN